MRLKPPVSNLNKGGFDLEKYYLGKNIVASGIILQATPIDLTLSLRQKIFNRLLLNLPALKNLDFIQALGFACKSAITPARYNLLQSAGLSHLLSISGLHIGLILYGLHAIFLRLLQLISSDDKCCNYAWPQALIGTFFYAYLVGGSIATLRALIMGVVAVILWQLNFSYNRWQIFIIAAIIVCLGNPFALFNLGLYLSFLAIAWLIILLNWRAISHKISYQFIFIIGFFPIQAFFFGAISLSAPIYNFFFIPWITMLVLPLTLIAQIISFFTPCAPIWYLIDNLWQVVSIAIAYAPASYIYLSSYQLGLLLVAYTLVPIIYLAYFYKMYLFLIAIVFIAGGHCYKEQLLKKTWRLTMLDVGHGLSVVLEKNKHALLYDTGASWDNGSIAKRVILPFLRWEGLYLDGVIISHDDNDHIGGYFDLRQAITHKWWVRSPNKKMLAATACVRGEHFYWQGIEFKALWPPKLVNRAYNNHSCVLLLNDGFNKILFTGDLESWAEYLLLSYQDNLDSAILILPHHGSNSSTTNALLKAVGPKLVLNSAARISRWHLPSKKVRARLNKISATLVNTGTVGQISLDFSKSNWQLRDYRTNFAPFWYHHIIDAK